MAVKKKYSKPICEEQVLGAYTFVMSELSGTDNPNPNPWGAPGKKTAAPIYC